MSTKYLILPGFGNSDETHWQSIWEKENSADYYRIVQEDWYNPSCIKWVEKLEQTVQKFDENLILIAHSLACLLVAHWSNVTKHKIRAALLVAAPDPRSIHFPKSIIGFQDFPVNKFKFKSSLIASTNDKYSSVEFIENCADKWGSKLYLIAGIGHINSDSKLGDWQEGKKILRELAGF